ncbi:MAG: arginine--tRNA ligase [Candidatus Nomurabacteria bacterium]|nr:arginine--tRNA ligase [Candidatus Nomurabacteria bacterium]
MQEKIEKLIKDVLSEMFDPDENLNYTLEHPSDLKNGDYSTNVAMVFFSTLRQDVRKSIGSDNINISGDYNLGHFEWKTPRDCAESIKNKILENKPDFLADIQIAGAGFINFHLSRKFFGRSVEKILNDGENFGKNNLLKGKKVMVEYTDPNPFKPFHIGHLMTNTIGESVARILEFSGADVARANYQGDVGLHVAKAIYGLLKNENLQSKKGSHNLQAENIGQAYVFGAGAYEDNLEAKKEIDAINKKIYNKSDKKINEIYEWGFDVTMEAFEDLYKMLGTKFDLYFLESQMMLIGEKIVHANVDKIFEKSDGAVVFKAEKYDPKLHTRVFITSQDLPTYETKELGLTEEKFKTDPDMDLSIVVTASEQMEYMRVVAKAISLIHPEFEKRMKHITHGMMRFASGKMGSRKGNVITGESLLNDVRDMVSEKMTDRDFSIVEQEKIATDVGVSAIKYSVLKQAIGGDIIYDFEKSISFEGDSGPYLQYSHARANSILEKAQKENILPDPHAMPSEIFEVEKLLYKFPEIVLRSVEEYEPHYVANYLIEVARAYNSFYGNNLIVDKKDKTSGYKVAITYAFTFVMKNGLHLLGIEAPKKM